MNKKMKITGMHGWGSGLLIVALVCTLNACGFRLRGSADGTILIPDVMRVTYIRSGSQYGDFTKALTKLINQHGAEVTKDRLLATGILDIMDNRVTRRTLSVDAGSKDQEFELSMQVTFKLLNKEGETVLEKESLSIERSYLFDKDDPLGKGNEEVILKKDMTRSLASRMLRVVRIKTQPNR
jgi:LPS-assembly lipoprotein